MMLPFPRQMLAMVAVCWAGWPSLLPAQTTKPPARPVEAGVPSSVRFWGPQCADTEARRGRFLQIDAGVNAAGVLRSDGRIFVNGINWTYICNVPPAPPGLHYTAFSMAGEAYVMALLSDGSAVAWGAFNGMQAWGTVTPPVAPPLPPGTRYVQVSAGDVAMLLRSDGALIVWGNNRYGQVNVPPLPPGTSYVSIQRGGGVSAAILSDGTLQIWGDNTNGLCNVPALPQGVSYQSVTFGFRNALALSSDGQIVAWGDNTSGQCNVPPLPNGVTYTAVAAGEAHGVAYRSDRTLVAWGYNAWGQCNVPTLPPGVGIRQLACGQIHSVALTTEGKVLTWGHNTFFDSTISEIPTGSMGEPLARYVDGSAGFYHALLVLSDGSLQVFGEYTQGGIPQLPPGLRYVRAKAGASHDLALRSDGMLVGWGDNSIGQCAVPALPPGTRYVDFALSSGHSVALRSDGVAVAFGNNASGECNVPALPAGTTYTDVAANRWKTILLRSDGQVLCLGDTSYNQGIVPVPPPGVHYVQVAACTNGTYSAALRSDGEVVIWYYPAPNYWPSCSLPALPPGVVYVEIEGGYHHFALRRSDGQIVTAGSIGNGEDRVPPLDPGTSYAQVCTSGVVTAGRVGPTCTYVSIATGCAGSRAATRLIPRDTPRIGATLEVRLFDLPQDAAVLVLGWRRLAVPQSLAGFGMPGCALAIGVHRAFFLGGTGNQTVLHMRIPDVPALVGMHFYHQAFVFDPAAGNPLGAVVSDAAEGVIGHW